jgi:hypothetical protein
LKNRLKKRELKIFLKFYSSFYKVFYLKKLKQSKGLFIITELKIKKAHVLRKINIKFFKLKSKILSEKNAIFFFRPNSNETFFLI